MATSGIVNRLARTDPASLSTARFGAAWSGATLDVDRQFAIVRKWLPLLVVSVVLAGGVAYLLANIQPRVYEAKATIIVGQSLTGVNPDYNQLLVSQRLSATYATIATTEPILTKVIQKLGLPITLKRLQPDVVASASQDTAVLSITARSGDPNTAAAIANAVATELIAASPAVEGQTTVLRSIDDDIAAIREDIKATRAQIDSLGATIDRKPAQETLFQTYQDRLVSLRSTYATLLAFSSNNGANILTVIQPAIPPDAAVGPRPLLSALLAAMIVFLVVSAIAFIAEYLDDAVKDPEQVDEVLGLPTLGAVERMPGGEDRQAMYRLAALLYPRSWVAETYRILRTNLEFASVDKRMRTVLVASAVPSEGKTVTAANLAVVMAQSGRHVLLIDADLRKPGVHQIFNLPDSHGLTDLLRSPALEPAALIHRTEQEHLEVLIAGPVPPNPAEILGSQRMKALVATLAENYDLLIFDSPPLEVFTDAAVLSSYLDGTILVVEARRGRRVKLRNAREALAKANANVMGVVINGLAPKAHADYGRYYSSAGGTESGAKPVPGVGVGSLVAGRDAPPPNVKSR